MKKLPAGTPFFATVALLLGLPLGSYFFQRYRVVTMCDDAIKAQLKAPATYKRVETVGGFRFNSGFQKIVYDAANGFGVPIRSKGLCMIDASGASWVEEPKLEDY